MQPLESEADAYAYLKVRALIVAPSGRFPHHLPTSSDMDGRRILTCVTGDQAGTAVKPSFIYTIPAMQNLRKKVRFLRNITLPCTSPSMHFV